MYYLIMRYFRSVISLKIIYGSLNIIDYAWVCLQKNHIMKKIDVYLNIIKLDEYVH